MEKKASSGFRVLKQALRQWEQAQKPPPKPPEPVPSPAPIPAVPPRFYTSEKVVGGMVRWEPVDRLAARVFFKAGWLEKPLPEVKPKEPEPETRKRKDRNMSKGVIKESDVYMEYEGTKIPNSPTNGPVRTEVINGQVHVNIDDVCACVIQEISKAPHALTPLARAAIDARQVLHEQTRGLEEMHRDSDQKAKGFLDSIRQTRYAVIGEVAQMTSALRDVRAFFLGNDYQTEIARLKEFVELCERLKVLKDSGFLDTVADTMLNLSSMPPKMG
jgi:hypothetical protein